MTIEHLGFKMYSHLPNAVAELVANSYDADASKVSVVISVDGNSIAVEDDGHGMSLDELQENYLRIGRNRREAVGSDASESGRRRVAGRKGLGKLSVFGIGDTIVVETKRSGESEYSKVTMVWNAIKESSGSEYRPGLERLSADTDAQFTRIRIENLNRKSEIKPRVLAEQLSRLFNYVDHDFLLEVKKGNDRITVSRDLRYESITAEADWSVPLEFRARNSSGIEAIGKVIASSKPLPAHLRGVTLYVRGRMANEPEFFGVPDSSQAFAYLTGYVDADNLDSVSDVISTDRRSVSWDSETATELRDYLAAVMREAAIKRRDLRSKANKERVEKDAGVDVDAWAASIRGPESAALRDVISTLVSPDNDIEEADRKTIVDGLRKIAPEYADLHWRALHPAIQRAAEVPYKTENFHYAVAEALKMYVQDVRRLASFGAGAEISVLQGSFSFNATTEPKVDVLAPYTGVALSHDTQRSIREAQRILSEAAWTGFRNPIQHELIQHLQDSGVFTYQDCLDALSLISHLRRRIGKIEEMSGHTDTSEQQAAE